MTALLRAGSSDNCVSFMGELELMGHALVRSLQSPHNQGWLSPRTPNPAGQATLMSDTGSEPEPRILGDSHGCPTKQSPYGAEVLKGRCPPIT